VTPNVELARLTQLRLRMAHAGLDTAVVSDDATRQLICFDRRPV
jgi:hypothetical protein